MTADYWDSGHSLAQAQDPDFHVTESDVDPTDPDFNPSRPVRKKSKASRARPSPRPAKPRTVQNVPFLPPELLDFIFRFAVHDAEARLFGLAPYELEPNNIEHHLSQLRRTLRSITSVCRLWRSMAISQKDLWNTIQTPWHPTGSTCPNHSTNLEEHATLRLLRRRQKSELSVFVYGFRSHAPLFRTLHSNKVHEDVTRVYLWWNGEDTGYHWLTSWKKKCYPRVRELVVQDCQGETKLSNTLEAYPNIEHLTIANRDLLYYTFHTSHTSLFLLRTLTMINCDVSAFCRWFQQLHAPRLEALHLDSAGVGRIDYDHQQPLRYSEETASSIRKVIIGGYIARQHAATVLTNLPNVTELHIKYPSQTNFRFEKTLDMLCARENGKGFTYCPELELLSYRNAQILLADLEDLVHVRKAAVPRTLRKVDLHAVKLMDGRKVAQRSFQVEGAFYREGPEPYVEVVG